MPQVALRPLLAAQPPAQAALAAHAEAAGDALAAQAKLRGRAERAEAEACAGRLWGAGGGRVRRCVGHWGAAEGLLSSRLRFICNFGR